MYTLLYKSYNIFYKLKLYQVSLGLDARAADMWIAAASLQFYL